MTANIRLVKPSHSFTKFPSRARAVLVSVVIASATVLTPSCIFTIMDHSTNTLELNSVPLQSQTIISKPISSSDPSFQSTVYHSSPKNLLSHMIGKVITPAAALRVGIVGPLSGTIALAMQAVYDGVKLAFTDQNTLHGGIQGKPIEWMIADAIPVINGVPTLMAESVVDAWMANESTRIDCLAIPPGSVLINALARAAVKHNLTIFGPTSGERDDFLTYDMHKVLIAPMPDIEIAALVRYIVLTRNMRRVAVMTTYGIGLGNDLIPYIKSLLAEFGLELTYQYVIGLPSKSIGLQAAEGAVKRPQALLQLGSIDVSTVSGIFAVYGTMDPSDCLIGSPGISYPLLVTAFSLLPAGSAGVGRLITSTYSPLQTDPNFQAASEYMRSLTANPSVVYFKKEALVGANFGYGVFAMTGFLIGNLMTSVFSSLGNNTINAQSIIDKTFSGWLVPAYDYVFGPYTTPCEGWRTISCGCHSGARQVHMAYFDAQLEMHPLPNAIYDISLDVCLPQNVQIQSPLIQLMATPNTTGLTADQRALVVAAHELYVAGDRAGYVNVSTSPSSRTGILLNTTYKSYTELATLQINRLTTVSTGSVYVDTIDAVSVNLTVALDPIYTSAPLYGGYSERVIHLGPTLQQEIHAFASTYAWSGINGITTTAGGFASALTDYFTKSANTFGSQFGSVSYVSSVASALAGAGGGVLFVHGIQTSADITAMDALLAREAGSVLLIPSQHLILWYDTIISTITVPSRRERVMFATNLPNWNPTSQSTASNTTLMKAYYAAMKAAGTPYSPQTLRGFLNQRVVANIVERIPSKLTQATFLSTLYAVSVVVLDADAYSIGPLSSASCGSGSIAGTDCQVNVGARLVTVRSLQAATSSIVSESSSRAGLFQFSSGAITYIPLPSEGGVSTLTIVLVICAAVVVALIVLIVVMKMCTGRSHGNAPKDQSKHFTIIFTDIQSSTSLWAEVPEEMAKAIDIHHKLIRVLIKKHNGYEVKTIGDAFMIAFKKADDAVRLAFDLQFTFYECTQFSPLIDQSYLNFDREKLAGELVHNLSCDLPEGDYAKYWKGIRVRVGINTDFGSIQRDEITNAYDYYGTVTNTSARVESVSHGGQVCFTDGTLNALEELRLQCIEGEVLPESALPMKGDPPSVALKMGPKELRGLTNNVLMYQLECVPGRLFPPLRLDHAENDELDDEIDESVMGNSEMQITGDGPTPDISAQPSTFGDTASQLSAATGKRDPYVPSLDIQTAHIVVAISTLLSRIPNPDKKAQEYRRLCDLWRIKVDKKTLERAKGWSAKSLGIHEDGVTKLVALHLTKDSGSAAHLEVLARRMRNIVAKNLQNAVNVTTGQTVFGLKDNQSQRPSQYGQSVNTKIAVPTGLVFKTRRTSSIARKGATPTSFEAHQHEAEVQSFASGGKLPADSSMKLPVVAVSLTGAPGSGDSTVKVL